MKPFFAVFEGIDGCGKGTQLSLTEQALKDSGIAEKRELVVTKEPGGTELGRALREIMFDRCPTSTLAPNVVDLLFLGAHIQNYQKIILPALSRNAIVLCDRYFYSQLAYMDQRPVHPVIRSTYMTLRGPQPDLVFLMHGNVHMLRQRAVNRKTETHQDKKTWNSDETLEAVQNAYMTQLAGESNCVLVPVHEGMSPERIFRAHVWPRILEGVST